MKCTRKKRGHSYICSVSGNRGPYSSAQIDFVAAFIIPTDTWYILPVAALHHSFDIWLAPDHPTCRYAEFKEAWHLLKR